MGRYRERLTEKQEKREDRRFDTAIWWVLWALCLFLVAYIVRMQYSEYKSIKGAKTVVANYTVSNKVERAAFRDEDGNFHSFDITGEGAEHDGDTIVLYYKDNIDLAEPRLSVGTWIRAYVLFGIPFVLLSVKLVFIYKPRRNDYETMQREN